MTNADKVRTYVNAHKSPVQESIPEFFQKWYTQHGPEYWRSSTCQRSQWTPDGAIVMAPGHSPVFTTYVNFIPEYDMLEISSVYINNTGRHKDYELYRWEYTEVRVFIVKGDPHPYDQLGNELWPEENRNGHNLGYVKYLKGLKDDFYNDYRNPQFDEFEKFCGKRMDFNTFTEKYQYKYRQTKLPEPKEDISEIVNAYLKRENRAECNRTWIKSFVIAYFEEINDKYAVVRCIKTWNRKGINRPALSKEFMRLYFSKNKVQKIVSDIKGWHAGAGMKLLNINVVNMQQMMQCKRLKYACETAETIAARLGKSLNVEYIYRLTRSPIIELLYKAGYCSIAEYLIENPSAFRTVFGKEESNKGSIYQKTGCNKWLLELIASNIPFRPEYREIGGALQILREIFGSDLMHFDLDKIGGYINAMIELDQRSKLRGISWKSIIPGCETITEKSKARINRFVNIYNKGSKDIFNVLADTSILYNTLGFMYDDTIAGNLHSAQDIYQLHNHATEIYNEEMKRIRTDKEFRNVVFERRQKSRRARFNYEDDNYLVRIPENIDEILVEGSRLGHCVGSYVNEHIMGRTNILFLREKKKPDIPFYTIEVRSDVVVQIHGSCNKWLGCNPEAVYFVYSWVKRLGLSCKLNILLNKSKRYSYENDMLDESYLYNSGKEVRLTA